MVEFFNNNDLNYELLMKLGYTMHFGLLYNLILYYSKSCLKNSYQRRIKEENNKNDEILFISS